VAIDTFSPNRNYVLPATGNDVNTWGPLLNGNFSAIDSNISALLTVSTTGGTTTLTAGQAANLFYNINGALTSNATVVFPAVIQTFFMATNNTTGSFTLTLQTANTGTTQTLAQGSFALFYSDGTNIFLISQNTPNVQVPVIITSAAITLTTAQSGFFVEMAGATSYTVTLPTAVGNGGVKYLFLAAGSSKTIASTAGNFFGPNGSQTTSLTLANGSTIFVISDGSSWITTDLTPNPAYALAGGSIGQTFSVAPATTSTMAPQLGQVFAGNASWQNVIGIRSLGGTFTNNTGKPISVSVVGLAQTTSATALSFFVNGANIGSSTSTNNLNNPMGVVFTVPPGATYMVQQSNPTALNIWQELF